MILGKNNSLQYSLKIGSVTVKESDEVELLGITIDKALNFKKYTENSFEKLSNCCDYFLSLSGFLDLSGKVFLVTFKFS